jgi:hypothetical protein
LTAAGAGTFAQNVEFINQELAKGVTWVLHCDNVPVMLTTVLPKLIGYSVYPESLEENSGKMP